jgi:hypothetical protein
MQLPVDAGARFWVAAAGSFLAGLELTRDGSIAVWQETT